MNLLKKTELKLKWLSGLISVYFLIWVLGFILEPYIRSSGLVVMLNYVRLSVSIAFFLYAGNVVFSTFVKQTAEVNETMRVYSLVFFIFSLGIFSFEGLLFYGSSGFISSFH